MAGRAGRTGPALKVSAGRWWLVVGVGVALLLFVGRWGAEWYTDQLWAGSVSTGASGALRRRALLGLGLDTIATLLATLWWAGNLMVAHRVALRLPTEAPGGNPRFRHLIAAREAHWWVLALGLTLGALSGAGASTVVDSVTLAWQGAHFGIVDPVLHADAGLYLAQLPLWLVLHAFATSLVLGGLGVVTGFMFLSGTLRLGRGRAGISSAARRQLAMLLAGLAVLIAIKFILLPYQATAGLPEPVGPELTQLYRSVGFLMVGVGLATTGLSLLWMARPIHALAAGGWLVLTFGLVASFYLLPGGGPWPATEQDRALQRRFDAVAYGVPDGGTIAVGGPSGGLPVSLWDEAALQSGSSSGMVLAAYRSPEEHALWLRITPLQSGGAQLALIRSDTAAGAGTPVDLPAGATTLPAGAIFPEATGVSVTQGGRGVPAGGVLRRAVLAWVLQSPELIRLSPSDRVAWERDPVRRLARLLPAVRWTSPRAVAAGNDWWWVYDGTLVAEAFPASSRLTWFGRSVGYARASLMGVVSPSGATGVYLRSRSDTLALALQRIWPELIHPASENPIPPGTLGYPASALRLQATLWARDTAYRLGRNPTEIRLAPLESTASSLAGMPIAVIEDTRTNRVLSVLVGQETGGLLRLHVSASDSSGLDAAAVLTRRWLRLPLVLALRDSVRALGDSLDSGLVRLGVDGATLLGYQPLWRIGAGGRRSLLAVGIAQGGRIGVGRTYQEAEQRLTEGTGPTIRPTPGESPVLFEARRYLREADSALRRGDLTTFGRAFAALRRILEAGSVPPDSQP